MTVPPPDSGERYGYAEALNLVHRGHFDQARARAQAATASAGAGPRAGTLSDLMAAAVTELLADLPDSGFYPYPVEVEQRAAATIDIALAARRPAWAAAIRGIQGAGMVAMGRREAGYEQLALGEAELAAEVARGSADPLGKPQGIAAAHNNLGYAYLLLEAVELAFPHLQQASAISRWGYGPELSVQAQMDVFNLGELHLRWAFLHDAVGNTAGCAEQAELVNDAAGTLTGGSPAAPDSPWLDAAKVLTTGARLLTAPDSISPNDLATLQRRTEDNGADFLSDLKMCLATRAARLLGEADAARGGARHLELRCSQFDPLLVRSAQFDADIAAANNIDEALALTVSKREEAIAYEQRRQVLVADLQARVSP